MSQRETTETIPLADHAGALVALGVAKQERLQPFRDRLDAAGGEVRRLLAADMVCAAHKAAVLTLSLSLELVRETRRWDASTAPTGEA